MTLTKLAVLLLCGMFFALTCADIVTTYIILGFDSDPVELNPIINNMFNEYGLILSLILKFIITCFVCWWILIRTSERTKLYVPIIFAIVLTIYGGYLLKYNALIFTYFELAAQ